MTATVRYYCPGCETVVAIEREEYLADKCVTPYPLAGWSYVPPAEYLSVDEDGESADGVRFVCGESTGVEWDGEGCGEPFCLSFVRFEAGREVEPVPESEFVELAGAEPRGPTGPSGPTRPG